MNLNNALTILLHNFERRLKLLVHDHESTIRLFGYVTRYKFDQNLANNVITDLCKIYSYQFTVAKDRIDKEYLIDLANDLHGYVVQKAMKENISRSSLPFLASTIIMTFVINYLVQCGFIMPIASKAISGEPLLPSKPADRVKSAQTSIPGFDLKERIRKWDICRNRI